MNKFKSKKGFTLAELLIVVAIIAVLVAIAVPLFVGGLQKAKDGTFQANKRAVKGAAVVYVLSLKDTELDLNTATADQLWFKAKVNHKSGEMGNVEKVTGTDYEGLQETSTYAEWTSTTVTGGDGITKAEDEIIVHLTITDIKAA